MIETSIERISGDTYCLVYTGERKFINQLHQLKQEYPNEIQLKDYGDGYLSAHVPYDWFHVPYDWFRFIKPPTKRNMTEEQRQAASERMKKAREQKGKD